MIVAPFKSSHGALVKLFKILTLNSGLFGRDNKYKIVFDSLLTDKYELPEIIFGKRTPIKCVVFATTELFEVVKHVFCPKSTNNEGIEGLIQKILCPRHEWKR